MTMREHIGLFRGKRISSGKWMEGYLLRLSDGTCLICQAGYRINRYKVDPDTIGECTGLKDKNGKLIFEGDIINGYISDGGNDFRSLPVSWDKLFVGWRAGELKGLYSCSVCIYEIIGNIYENPELLKGGEG